ncbi:polyketide synthase, partial [Archangium sp.]|uniref:type I polyketide synthase n=1 Tax=Archangium sp. TaxID=1872627 RepID=UPI002D47229B
MSAAELEGEMAPEGIAIIGMAGRFPGARDVEALWKNLREGVDSITRLTGPGREAGYVAARGQLEDVNLFDASFFHCSPREAESIDPQQRLFLECVWEALENAGHDPARVSGPIGLFAGAGAPGYLLHHVAPHLGTQGLLEELGFILGNDKDHLTTRVAYKLNLRGPVVTVQTACSTSLVAVQLACEALRSFQCDMALAGGVSIAFPLGTGYRTQEGHILSPDGHCRSFDARAQGTVPADGLGLVVLKRLEDALRDGDCIRAVILGAAINNDGSDKVGYTAPSIDGQAEVIQLAQALAGANARSISYVETHGTATALGDAIEIAALTKAFRRTTRERGFCAIGSLKSNLGHLNTAAGVASLIKTALALENRLIPPSLHFQQPHPGLGLEESPFFVNTTAREWKPGPTPRRAGVSSFAMGGTNAHAVLEEAPPRESRPPAEPWQLLVLSARTAPALEAMTERLRAHLERHADLDLADVAHTLQAGRRAFGHRRALVCQDMADALRALQDSRRFHRGTAPDTAPGVAFLFSGQGTPYAGMAKELYQSEAVFREAVDHCARLLRPGLGFDLRDVLYPGGQESRSEAARLEGAAAQPVLFTIQYALARLWMSRGVRPVAMLGHDAGEYVAACLAEVFTLEDALALVVARGRLMQGLPNTFEAEVGRIRPSPPRLPYISHVTGTWVTEEEATSPGYWLQHPRRPGRFAAGLAELSREGGHLLLQAGPGEEAPNVLSSLRASREDGRSDREVWLAALGQLWAWGVPVAWNAQPAGRKAYRVPLPSYPFERRRYWLDRPVASSTAPAAVAERPLEELEEELRRTSGIRPVEDYPGLEEGLHALCTSHLCAYLRGAGVDTQRGALHGRKALEQKLAIQPRFSRLFEAMLASLEEDGLLRVQGDDILFLRDAKEWAAAREYRQRLDAAHPGFQGLFDFVEHCLGSYDKALSGRIEPIGVLYPDGSAHFIQDCEARTAEHRSERIYNQLLTELLRRLATTSRGRKLRILEVGGGQGSLTWPLMSVLLQFDVEYHFTDIGKAFVDDARQEAERRGLGAHMSFGVLDLSKPPRAQGYATESFDVIVAFNVVHATRDVPQALRHLEQLLAPGGLLGLVEAVKTHRWETLSWGLAEGWWYFDDDLRARSPLMPLSRWEQALTDLGFERIESFPRSEEARARVDHGLVIARRRPMASSAPRPSSGESPAPSAPGARMRHPRPQMNTEYLAPRNDLERHLVALCEDLLDVAPIGIRDDFFALGGDSLVMLRLTDQLRKELDMEIPPSAAFRGGTMEQMVQALRGVPDPRGSSPLVPIQPTGTRPPLFFVHPAAGVVFPYFELARHLGPDQPFYGLQALGLDGGSEPDERIEDMARHYIEAIRRIQPTGPYFIGGYSFGCLVAYEIAQQLSAAGQEIGLLAIVDEPAPLSGHRPTLLEITRFFTTGVARSIWPHLHDYLYLVNTARQRRRGASPSPLPESSPLRRWDLDGRMLESFLARAALANFVPPDSRLLALRQPAMLPMFRLFQ